MRLHRLRLLNFRQHADTTISLDLGLTGVVGPNGSGKTTLLEAIAWAMYGTPAARGTRDSIRRRSAPARSRVEVELDFELGPHRYRVQRSLQGAALYLDSETAPVANSAAAVTERVTRLLGMTREEFFNTYFTGQKELAIMGSMTGPDRARFLSRVLGYERLATAQVILKELRTGLKAAHQTAEAGLLDQATLEREEQEAVARLDGAEATLARSRVAAAAAVKAHEELIPTWEVLQKRRDEVLSIETDLRVGLHRAEEAKRVVQELDRQLADSLAAKTRCDELAPSVSGWESLIALRDKLDADAQAFAGRRALEAQAREVEIQLARLNERLARLPEGTALDVAKAELVVAHDAARQVAAEVEELHGAWVRDKQDAETKRQHLLEQHDDVEQQLQRLRSTGPTVVCPTCGKPLGKEYETVLDDLQGRLDEIVLQGKFYRQRIAQLTNQPAELAQARLTLGNTEATAKGHTAAVAKLEALLVERRQVEAEQAKGAERLAQLMASIEATPGRFDEAEHRAVKARLAGLEPLREQFTRLTVVADRAADLVPRFAAAEQDLSRAEAAVIALRERLALLGWSTEAYDTLRARIQRAELERRAAEIGTVRADAELVAAREHRRAVGVRRTERDRQAAEIERLWDELTLKQELDRAFSDLRDQLNETIRPDLSDAASVLIRDLTHGRYSELELSEDYEPTIFDEGEPKTVISGGEEDIANLALRLAISQMIADRAGQPFSLLVLDEIFGSLDEERRVAVVDLLRGLADRFPQVVLITHIESVRDGFDRVIRIDYDREHGTAIAREEGPGLEFPHVAA